LDSINTILGTPLGYIVYLAYRLTNNYGLAIVLFAIVVKIVLFPIMILAHKNSIRLLQLQPALYVIKQRYVDDKSGLNEAQHKLFTKEKYNPLLGILPLLIQLILIMGMLQVMYRPLQHILRIDAYGIDVLVQTLHELSIDGGIAPQLVVMEVFALNREAFYMALSSVINGEYIFHTISTTNMCFIGLNLGVVPSFVNPSWALLIILFSGIAALSFCLVQNFISPGALSQSGRTNKGLTIFTVGLSLYFAWALPVGVGLYWTVGNFAAIIVVFVLNLLYPPKQLAAEALLQLQTTHKTLEQLQGDRRIKNELRQREKTDSCRFKSAKKQLVFYAISGGQFKYYKTIINYLLEHTNLVIHYLTNDPNDTIFNYKHPQIVAYYASQQKTISLMLKLDTDILVTTVQDLQIFHMKRSIVRENIEYIHIIHGPSSTLVACREKAFDYFDTIFCVGPHNVTEIRRREAIANLPKKTLVKVGYGQYDQLVESYSKMILANKNECPQILIAPSWQPDNILESCIETVLDALVGRGYSIIVRPHMQFVRLFPQRIDELINRYSLYVNNKEIKFELDFLDNNSIFSSDLLISDWSGIGYEFAYCTLKPCVFINTPMKILNPNYKRYGLEALDIGLRNKIGITVDIEEVYNLNEHVTHLLVNKNSYQEQIKQTIDQNLYNPGRSGEAGGKYLISRLDNIGGRDKV